LAQPEFAARFGLSVETVRDWEPGRTIPPRFCCASSRLSRNWFAGSWRRRGSGGAGQPPTPSASPALSEADQDKRRDFVWQIDRKLQEQAVRPIMYHGVTVTCWHNVSAA
jgi:hypothetical protein